jgi:hypothetical protein
MFAPNFGRLVLERKRSADDVKDKYLRAGQEILFNIFWGSSMTKTSSHEGKQTYKACVQL